MPREFFLVPMVGDGASRAGSRHPKYSDDVAVTAFSSTSYSVQDDAIVLIEAAQAYLNSVAGQSDALRICTEAQLDNTLSGPQRTAATNALEARQIPAGWIAAGVTFRTVIRTVAHIFLLNGRLENIFCRPFHDQVHTWLQNGGLRNVVGHESEPIPDTREELQRQGKILMALTWSELPAGVQNYLIGVRDRQGWKNADLGLTASSTVREILRAMGSQGVGIRRRLERHGLTLNSTWADFPQPFKDELTEVVQDWGLNPASLGLSGTSTLRQILKTFADQFAAKAIDFNGLVV